jgi:hypothetical protein
MLSWDLVKAEFAWEGSWRDICIRDVQLDDWRSAIQAVLSSGLRSVFSVDGVEGAFPVDVAQTFARCGEAAALLSVFTRNARLNCHFFDETEIEFDLDPREVVGQADLDDVINFMALLATTTHKPALLTPENMHDAPFIRVDPRGTTEYISSEGFFEQLARSRS